MLTWVHAVLIHAQCSPQHTEKNTCKLFDMDIATEDGGHLAS